MYIAALGQLSNRLLFALDFSSPQQAQVSDLTGANHGRARHIDPSGDAGDSNHEQELQTADAPSR